MYFFFLQIILINICKQEENTKTKLKIEKEEEEERSSVFGNKYFKSKTINLSHS